MITSSAILWTPALVAVRHVGQPTDFPGVWAKLVRFEQVLELDSPFVKRVAEQMLLRASSGFRHYLFDVKDQTLERGENPCNGLWHGDSALNAEHEYENYLYVSGQHALTQFADEPVETPIAENGIELDRAVSNVVGKTVKIASGTIHRYDQSTLHRGVSAAYGERRLLVRLTCSNRRPVVGPQIKRL